MSHATDPAEVGRLWDANAASWIALSRAGYDLYRDHVNTPAFLALLPPVTGLHGLDIGCGEATNTRAVAARASSMTGLDISATFLVAAAATEAASPLGIRFVRGTALALPFAPETFAFATAFMSLMDVPRPEQALAEAARVLRPGGVLLVADLAPHGEGAVLSRFAHRWPGFDDAALAGWLGQAGCALAAVQEINGRLPVRVWRAEKLAADALTHA